MCRDAQAAGASVLVAWAGVGVAGGRAVIGYIARTLLLIVGFEGDCVVDFVCRVLYVDWDARRHPLEGMDAVV